MEISCAFPPGPHVVDHIVEAERLGYERAWLFDSPALYGDIWVIAALAAAAHVAHRARARGARSESSPPVGAGERDRHARAARAGTGRGRDRYRLHRSHGDGAEAAHVGVDAAVHRAAARVAAGREGRGRRRDRADAARSRLRAAVPDQHADRHRRERTEGCRGRERVRRRDHDDRRRQRRLRLVLGARVRHGARRGRESGFGACARGRRPGAHGRVPRDVRRRSRVGRRVCPAASSGASSSRRFPRPNVISRFTTSTSSA